MRKQLAFVAFSSLLLTGCPSGGGGNDDSIKTKLAGDLVQCQNNVSSLKEKMSELGAENRKLKNAADAPLALDPITLRAGSAPRVRARRDGNIPPEQLSAVIAKNSGGLRVCYERGLKRKPNLQYISSVNVRFMVKNTGEATDIKFAPHSDAEMEQCMAAAMTKWKFPAFQGEAVQVEAPVNLIAK